ncbi:hypothetical protein D3C71_2208490 [compost metagenome]
MRLERAFEFVKDYNTITAVRTTSTTAAATPERTSINRLPASNTYTTFTNSCN